MIVAKNITRRFGDLVALDRVNFSIERGEIVGFIGPNGAGKTTTMRILTGFLPATEGRAEVAGHDIFDEPMSVRRKVGYLPETPPLYPELTIGVYLRFIAEIREIPRAERSRRIGTVMEQVGLQGWEGRILSSLSKGYRQRVGLAQAVLHEPEVLILDEPTSGLDPAQVVGIRKFIQGLAEERTVILSTHILPEVEKLCQRAIIINKGQITIDRPIDALRASTGLGLRYRVELRSDTLEEGTIPTRIGQLEEVDRVTPRSTDAGFEILEVHGSTDPRLAIARLAAEEGWQLRSMARQLPSLEEAFLEQVGFER